MKNLITTILILIGFILVIPANAYCWFDKPTAEDYVLQTGFIGLMIVDWKQTNWISDNPKIFDGYTYSPGMKTAHYTEHEEWNPILGKHPSHKKIAVYFSSSIILHTGISYILPKPYRNLFQVTGIGFELHATINNYKAGVKINF